MWCRSVSNNPNLADAVVAGLLSSTRLSTHSRLTAICSGLPGWAGTRRNIHPLTPILVIKHPLSTASICYDPWHLPCSIYVLDSPFPQPLSRSSVVFLLVWNPLFHTPYISSPNHYLFFRNTHHRNLFAVVPRLYHLFRISLSSLLGNIFTLTPHIRLIILVSAGCTSFSFRSCIISM